MSSWIVLFDRYPLAPTDPALGTVDAPDRESALSQAQQLHGPHVLVVDGRSWQPKGTTTQLGLGLAIDAPASPSAQPRLARAVRTFAFRRRRRS